MDTRMSIMCGGLRFLIATSVALTLLMAVAATSAAAASPTSCLVQNAATGRNYTSLQDAVDAAHRADRLQVRGLCRGRTVIHKDIGITGRSDTASSRKPILAGPDRTVRPTAVLSVRAGARVHVRTLRIEGPDEDICGPRGQGLRNSGDLTLIDVRVRRLCRVVNGGTLTLAGMSVVEHNCSPRVSNVAVWNQGVMRMEDASGIKRNAPGCPTRPSQGDFILANSGTFTMHDGSLITYHAEELGNGGTLTLNGTSLISRMGGRFFNSEGAVLTLNDSSSISAPSDLSPMVPCGVGRGRIRCPTISYGVINRGDLILNDLSSIRDFTTRGRVAGRGGGVLNRGNVILNDTSTISGNSAGLGGGVFNMGSLTLNDTSTISGNTARRQGGGVYMAWWGDDPPPTLTMTGSSAISGNSAGDGGGGIWYSSSDATVVGVKCGTETLANVYGNTPDDCYFESP